MLFYSSNCPHSCTFIKSQTWSDILNLGIPIKYIECGKPQGFNSAQTYNISAIPTLIYIKDGHMFTYTNHENINNFIQSV